MSSVAVDLQEYRAGWPAELTAPGPPGRSPRRSPRCCTALATACRPTARPGRQPAPGPQRPVRVHQRAGASRSSGAGQPVISVDTKKKELVGDFKNAGPGVAAGGAAARRWTCTTSPTRTWARSIPYGVYDLAAQRGVGERGDRSRHGRVRRGVDPAVVAPDGQPALPAARRELLITADGGGSNGSRSRLWKVRLQELADETGLRISVCHFPPGHQQVEQDRAPDVLPHHRELAGPAAGQPRGDRQPDREHDHDDRPEDPRGLDRKTYPTGIKISDAELVRCASSRRGFTGTGTTPFFRSLDRT